VEQGKPQTFHQEMFGVKHFPLNLTALQRGRPIQHCCSNGLQ